MHGFVWWLRRWWYRNIYLKSDSWRETRAAALKRDRYRCTKCGANGKKTDWLGRRNPLQVHHKSYAHVGRELDEELTVLCRACHMKKHERVTDVRSGQVAAVFLFFLLVLFILSRCSLT
jgi:5-methylcytosine-specific restriction endonuclease McrA